MDRYYFESVLVTDEQGFTIARFIATLGEKLHLPPKFDYRRLDIDALLEPLE